MPNNSDDQFKFAIDEVFDPNTISVYPENEDNYCQPDIGFEVLIEDEVFEVVAVEQEEDSHRYNLTLNATPIIKEMTCYVKPK